MTQDQKDNIAFIRKSMIESGDPHLVRLESEITDLELLRLRKMLGATRPVSLRENIGSVI